jgi:nitrate reductase gamma subunit
MMTLRRFLTAQYDWTGLSSKLYKSKVWEIGSLFVVGMVVLLLVAYYHLNVAELELDEFVSIPMGMEHMFDLIETFTVLVFLIPLLILFSNAVRMYWFTIHRETQTKIPVPLYLTEAKTLLLHTVTQKRLRDCTDKSRWTKHLLLVAGCGLMMCIKVLFLDWFQTDSIYPVVHPQRWLGYIAAGALIYATMEILISRIRKREEVHRFSDPSDWILPIMLLLTAMSGLAVHVFRYMEFDLTAHFAYAIHLAIAVPMLVIEIPFGKWSHMVYRPLAIYFQAVKERALQKEMANESS